MNSCVIVAADAEGPGGEPLAVGQFALCALLLQQVEQSSVFSLGGHDDDVAEVLGSCTDEADATYVDFLDDVGLACTGSHRVLEGVEVHDDQVDVGDVVLLHLLAVALVLPAAQYAAEHFRVQRLHTSAQDAGVGCHVLHLAAGYAEALDESLGAARREKLYTFGVQCAQNLFQSVLMEYGNQGTSYSSCLHFCIV